ncbi:hypothetical protein Lal_00028197 [Lupinus albus]|nr:hypothetical protein Lal_00028197 [Lupinus albus]
MSKIKIIIYEYVNLNRPRYKDEHFILVSQVRQVFYVNDPTDKKWSFIVLTSKVIITNIDDQKHKYTNIKDDLFLA